MDFLKELGIEDLNSGAFCGRWLDCKGSSFDSHSPATGERIASVTAATGSELEEVTSAAHDAFLRWREVPAPLRGEYVRRMGERMREKKEALGRLLTFEMGKILEEGRGEIQECIDIADFAVGLSRQLYGLTIASERPQHSMRETWHPLGNVGVITAFNFPAAVWAWNSMLALVCGDSVVWKPSEKTPLIAIAMTKLCAEVLEEDGFGALLGMAVGSNDDVAIPMTEDPRYPLISATGSTRMGKAVGQVVASRLGRSLLELGGNNAVICLEDADLDMVLRAVLFGAVGTAGQRCTTTRRLLIHKNVRADFEKRLLEAYTQVRIGDPLEASTLMGPLIDKDAIENMQASLKAAKEQGGELLCGGDVLSLDGSLAGGNFVSPAIVRISHEAPIVQHETFAPILYIIEIDDMEHAMRLHNSVPQGLSSAVFTSDVRRAERFLSAIGSDCGIANVNLGTSGAEIGGAFGGEKETGGGRESGSDSWKAYMRRQTSTINWGSELPLAQGITFG